MKYSFVARDLKGKQQKGTIEASSREAVLDILASQNLFPVAIEEETAKKGALNFTLSAEFLIKILLCSPDNWLL